MKRSLFILFILLGYSTVTLPVNHQYLIKKVKEIATTNDPVKLIQELLILKEIAEQAEQPISPKLLNRINDLIIFTECKLNEQKLQNELKKLSLN